MLFLNTKFIHEGSLQGSDLEKKQFFKIVESFVTVLLKTMVTFLLKTTLLNPLHYSKPI